MRLFFVIGVTLAGVAALGAATQEAPDGTTRAALFVSESGGALALKELRLVASYLGRVRGWPVGVTDLAMRVAILKLEIGQEMSGDDMLWMGRYLGRPGATLPFLEARRRISYDPSARESDFRLGEKIAAWAFPQIQDRRLEPLAVLKVLRQDHSCIFQRRDGRTYILQYGVGIVFTNYREGDFFLAETNRGDIRTGTPLIRMRGDQTSRVVNCIALQPEPSGRR
ncbi:MAG: hypothetical protein EXS37_15115 [Opitutus sp.]|nr:hypothetical protein [Opitutus sp.]